jgi:hypothetical protein
MASGSNIQRNGNVTEYYADGVAIQPNYSLTEKNDGTIEGNVTFMTDMDRFGNLPQMKSPHPRESRCEIYNREITYLPLRKVQLVASYFGLISNKTEPVLAYTPNTDKEPIETHPLFEEFAGTKASPKNGAKFDDDTGEFLGFYDQAIKDLFGAAHYLVPATMVSLTYWQSSVPSLARRMSIKASVPGFRKPSDVKDFLLLDIPYRQIGSFYQVTEQYLGSGPNGFSKKIYK